jgi:hypothetical protein
MTYVKCKANKRELKMISIQKIKNQNRVLTQTDDSG